VAITEDNRRRLYQRLEEVLGAEQAATLMEHLPPVGWADVATKRDLDAVRASIDHLADKLRAEWRHELLTQTFAVLAANATLAGIAFAAARLT
jgi:hypothetical protein